MSKNTKLIEALRKNGVALSAINAAMLDLSRVEVNVNRKTLKRIRMKLQRIGDKCVLTLKPNGVKVLSLQGYQNLTGNVKKARAAKQVKADGKSG